jgi:hypothetical protein
MKKSKHIQLVLITAALASCHSQPEWHGSNRTYIRSDSTAPYTRMNYYHPGIPFIYYHFRPYGVYFPVGGYRRVGYYSDALPGSVIRGGFGKSAFSVES